MSLGGTGLRDWLFQRLTAVILAAYTILIMIYLGLYYPVDFNTWQNLFNNPFMRIASVLALMSLSLHAWLGLWIIMTDYIKPIILGLIIKGLVLISILGYLIWGVKLIWG